MDQKKCANIFSIKTNENTFIKNNQKRARITEVIEIQKPQNRKRKQQGIVQTTPYHTGDMSIDKSFDRFSFASYYFL